MENVCRSSMLLIFNENKIYVHFSDDAKHGLCMKVKITGQQG